MNHIVIQNFLFDEDDKCKYLYQNFYNSLKNINYKDKLAVFTNKPEIISEWSSGIDTIIIEKNYTSKVNFLITNEYKEQFNVSHILKFIYINEYIKDLNEFDNIFYADARDSILQKNIFKCDIDFNKINFSTEDCIFFNNWAQEISKDFNDEVNNFFFQNSDRFKMINCGGILSNVTTFKKYISYFLSNATKDRKNLHHICDQILNNKLYYFDKCPYINLVDNLILCSGWQHKLVYDEKTFLLNGEIPSWVHQYERNSKFNLSLFDKN